MRTPGSLFPDYNQKLFRQFTIDVDGRILLKSLKLYLSEDVVKNHYYGLKNGYFKKYIFTQYIQIY